jgi:thioester reductase-like protein
LKNTRRVEALATNFNKPYFGYKKKLYEKLKEEVTTVQHCAWELNFNMPIDYFDRECISPLYNILLFAYKDANPMHVYFVSSISASAAAGNEIEETPLPFDSHVAMPMGYAQSKFVVEMLFNYLAAEKQFPCYIQRLGQGCDDSVNGVWNISEQYPLMFVGGGSIMHKMPELDINIDWITIDYAATSIVETVLHTASLAADKECNIFHIVNPYIIHWSKTLDAMRSSGMTFETVPIADWIGALYKDESNSAFRLIAFYEDIFKKSSIIPIWKTEKTREITPIIENAPVLDVKLFSKFLNYWESAGFYNASLSSKPSPILKYKRKKFKMKKIPIVMKKVNIFTAKTI